MKKIITLILAGCIALSTTACTIEQAANSAVDLVNSLNTSDSPEVKSVKNSYLTSYSDKITVGKALDSFLGNPIWQYFESEDHQKVVQCNGTCQYNDKTVEAKIQFLLNDDDTFEIHAMSLNDIDQNMLMMAAFMGKVYESAGVEDAWEDDSAEDELKGSTSTSSSQNTQVSTQTNTQTNNNNSVSTPPPYGDIGDVGVISTDGYDLDQYYVTDTLLDRLSQDEVRILLNALYAHYGYTFTTEQYAQFFSSKPWYSSRGTSMSDCESRFNDYERKNKETITAYETRKGWRKTLFIILATLVLSLTSCAMSTDEIETYLTSIDSSYQNGAYKQAQTEIEKLNKSTKNMTEEQKSKYEELQPLIEYATQKAVRLIML